jgi:putative transposase
VEAAVQKISMKMRYRSQEFAAARSVMSYFAVRGLGHNGAEVARMLNMSRSGVSIAAGRGEEFLRKNRSVKKLLNVSKQLIPEK